MIRRDYLLRQTEEFVAAMAKLAGLAKNAQWQEAATVAGLQFRALAGADASELVLLSDTDLLARVIQGEPTHVVENKIFMLATLFKAQGDLLAGQGKHEESRPCYLKGLHLLLDTFVQNEFSKRYDFVPTVETFLIGLHDSMLPMQTNVLLMRHYEQISDFARAEDALFAMLESEPANAKLLDFGAAFYRRLLLLSDETLATGNLPRAEVNARLAELNRRKTGPDAPSV
jgi:hypothetical protein